MAAEQASDGDDAPSPQTYGVDDDVLARVVGQIQTASWGLRENPLATNDELLRCSQYVEALLVWRRSGRREVCMPRGVIDAVMHPPRQPTPEDFQISPQLMTRVQDRRYLESKGASQPPIANLQERCRAALYTLCLEEWNGRCPEGAEAIPEVRHDHVSPPDGAVQQLGSGRNVSLGASDPPPAASQAGRSGIAGQLIPILLGAFGLILGGAIGGAVGAVVGAGLMGGVGGVLVTLVRSEK